MCPALDLWRLTLKVYPKMYTGIVTATFPLAVFEREAESATLGFDFDEVHLKELQIGASVSLDGICMSVVSIEGSRVTFNASIETLRRTNLADKKVGSLMNIERSAKAGVEIGGHPMSGHVDGTVEVIAVERSENNCVLTLELPAPYRRYVFDKGFIGLNGCSLTITELDRSSGRFKIYLIPETLRQTTYDETVVGDRINFEIDRQTQVMVDTIHDAVRLALSEMKLETA
jgi:riboflavin synthase